MSEFDEWFDQCLPADNFPSGMYLVRESFREIASQAYDQGRRDAYMDIAIGSTSSLYDIADK